MVTALRKAKFKWHCRRGMLELDLILMHFIENHLDSMTEKQVDDFDTLLSCTDPELFSWLMGHEQPSDPELKNLVEFIQLHTQVRKVD